jgi:enamine deaminase RidA (YjgF/YER057c/UK114 family)
VQVTIERLAPEGLQSVATFAHVVRAKGVSVLVVTSGQVALDARGQVVAEGDLAEQAKQAYRNLRIALEFAGASPEDVIKLTIYVVGYEPQMLPALTEARRAEFDNVVTAATLVGVEALAQPEFLVEIEAFAIVS